MRLSAAFKQRCESIAVDWRYRLGRLPVDPLPADILLKAVDSQGETRTPDQMTNMPSESVALLLNKNDWYAGVVRLNPLLIIYHPAHSPARYQSSVMHELAHILLKHPMVGFDPLTGLPLRDVRHETEAAYLGGCLQIPRLALQWAVHQCYTVMQTAAHFGASEDMVEYRRNVTGIQ